MSILNRLKKLSYKVDSKMCDDLHLITKKLVGSEVHGTLAELCLLGEKDNLVDTFVQVKHDNGGCGGAPAISYTNMDNAFVKMLKTDRTVVGMALVRPPYKVTSYGGNVLGRDLEKHIHNWRNTFEDIDKTIWLIICNDTIKSYRVKKLNDDKVNIVERNTKTLYRAFSKSELLSKQTNLKLKKKKAVKKTEIKKEPVKKEVKKELDGITRVSLSHVLIKTSSGKEILWTA